MAGRRLHRVHGRVRVNQKDFERLEKKLREIAEAQEALGWMLKDLITRARVYGCQASSGLKR